MLPHKFDVCPDEHDDHGDHVNDEFMDGESLLRESSRFPEDHENYVDGGDYGDADSPSGHVCDNCFQGASYVFGGEF